MHWPAWHLELLRQAPRSGSPSPYITQFNRRIKPCTDAVFRLVISTELTKPAAGHCQLDGTVAQSIGLDALFSSCLFEGAPLLDDSLSAITSRIGRGGVVGTKCLDQVLQGIDPGLEGIDLSRQLASLVRLLSDSGIELDVFSGRAFGYNA